MAVQDCPGSAGTGSPHVLGPEEELQGGTRSSPPSGAARSVPHVPPSLPVPLENAGSSSAALKTTTLLSELFTLLLPRVLLELTQLEVTAV